MRCRSGCRAQGLAVAGLFDRGVDALACAFVSGVGEGGQLELGERPLQRGERAAVAGQADVVAVTGRGVAAPDREAVGAHDRLHETAGW